MQACSLHVLQGTLTPPQNSMTSPHRFEGVNSIAERPGVGQGWGGGYSGRSTMLIGPSQLGTGRLIRIHFDLSAAVLIYTFVFGSWWHPF